MVSARQRALDLAEVVDFYEGNVNRRWRTEAHTLNDDRRRPIIWITPDIGVVYACFTVLHVDNKDYCPVLTPDN
ncbi:MAG: hypothetical protein ACKPKO_00810 [Candidatus Fonsibacter sp.]